MNTKTQALTVEMAFSKSTKGMHVYAALDAGAAAATTILCVKERARRDAAPEDHTDDRGQRMNREAASADEAAGMEWWNALTEEQRAYWLDVANTAIVGEAWAYHKHVVSQLPD